MSLVPMTATAGAGATEQGAPKHAFRRYLRPALGLILPVGLALGWELAVRAGLSNGRLVPPPSVCLLYTSDAADE